MKIGECARVGVMRKVIIGIFEDKIFLEVIKVLIFF